MEIIQDPKQVERLARQREDENWRFVFNVIEALKFELRWPGLRRWRGRSRRRR